MKTILVIMDGLGDRSYKILNYRTPLEAADTPNLDRLAHIGGNGLIHAALPGQCLPSEIAHYLLFGYEMDKFPGRGLLEAVGEGVEFDDVDVLCLAHLSSVTWRDGIPILTHGRDDIKGSAREIGMLFDAVSQYETGGIKFKLHHTRRNDAILVISGQVSPHVSDSDPMITGEPVGRIVPLSGNPEPEKAKQTAKALNDYLTYCHRVLSELQNKPEGSPANSQSANFMVTQRCGRRIVQEPFTRHWGLKGLFIASASVYAGLAQELDLTFIRVKDSPNPAKDLKERIGLALADISHDFVLVHTKVPDEAAHSGDPKNKKAAITSLDQGFNELVKAVAVRNDLLVVVTADHSTPSLSPLIHSGEPVPVVFAGPTVRRDKVSSFDEVSAATGCLGLLRGQELMLTILNYTDRSGLMGHRMNKTERPYTPQIYEPFKMTDL